MPPRHAYWTIVVDDQPTAFRAHDAEELLATLNRLRERHPSAVMKWFERGRLWESRDAAREVGLGQGERRWEGPRPDRAANPEREKPRDRAWRPGGDHRDPRQKYKDAKKAKWDRFKQNVRDRGERAAAARGSDPRKFSPPHGDPLRDKIDEPAKRGAPTRPEGQRDRRDFRPSSGDDRRGGWKPNAPPRGPTGWKPKGPPRGDRPPADRHRGGWQGRERPGGDWRDRPPRDRERPRSEWTDRPPRDRDRGGDFRSTSSPPPGSRKPWSSKPGGVRTKKPWGAKPGGAGARKPWGAKPAGAGRPKAGGKGPGYRGPGRPGGGKGTRGPRKPRGG